MSGRKKKSTGPADDCRTKELGKKNRGDDWARKPGNVQRRGTGRAMSTDLRGKKACKWRKEGTWPQ